MTKPITIGIVSFGAALLLVAGSASAQDSFKCSAARLKGAGKYSDARLKCYSKAAQKGEPVDAVCLQKALDKITAEYAKAFDKGGCATDGDPEGNITNTVTRLNNYTNAVDGRLSPGAPPALSKCQSKKLKSVGKYVGTLFKCESNAAKKNEVTRDDKPLTQTKYEKCVAKANEKLTKDFTKEDTKVGNDCTTTGDLILEGGDGTDVVRLQTFYTPRFDGCGNRVVKAPETCDDGNTENFDFCPSDCSVDICVPTGVTQQVTITTSTGSIAALELGLDYPEGKLALIGSGLIDPSPIIPAGGGEAFTFDFDHALNFVYIDIFDLGTTSIATVDFTTCIGAPPAVPADFQCIVKSAAGEVSGEITPVPTCGVTIP